MHLTITHRSMVTDKSSLMAVGLHTELTIPVNSQNTENKEPKKKQKSIDSGNEKQGSVIVDSSQSSTSPGSPPDGGLPLRNIGESIFPKNFVDRTAQCHVCACLGRETSMVPCGSRCPSCGNTASDS